MMNISAAFLSAVLVYSKAAVQGCSQEKLFWKFLKNVFFVLKEIKHVP